ncbi:MAG: hypothetical protein LQ349_008543 [Xanthoria aureola]|nr:MAG: hypothetical protein LQ349_008543 [Xanthoria aureola]
MKMASHRPFRARPNLHLTLTQQTGSPRNLNAVGPASSRYASPFSTPTVSPLATTSYSPYASAKLKAPSPYGSAMHFTPRQKHKYRRHCRAVLQTIKRMLLTRTTWLLMILMLTMVWWLNGGSEELGAVKLGAAGFGKDLFQDGVTQNMQFFPPSNPKIHYVGRWTPTPNRLRKDGAFPGVYFDIIIKNTTSLYLSLRNSPNQAAVSAAASSAEASPSLSSKGHLSFRPNSANDKPAPPISLLARVDQEEYVLLPKASALVPVCSGSLQHDTVHNIRIIAPMTDDGGRGVIQLEGIWLSKGGYFERIEGLSSSDGSSDGDPLSAQSDEVGEKHRSGLSKLLRGSGHGGRVQHQEILHHEESRDFRDRRKNLEVITDIPGSFGGRNRGKRSGGADGLLAGVMGWEYLLGEMFSVDHTAIGVDGMCLIQECIGGVGHPAGLGDIFFRSGPPDTAYSDLPWMFNVHVPDVLILNLGNSDKTSFDEHSSEYNKTAWDLAERFEDTYVSLIKAIRTLAYPKHPSTIQSERSGYSIYVPNSIPAAVPIFVMRPLRGELEHATQNIVNRIRAAGDKYVYWLDTSGWLDPNSSLDSESSNQDFYLDDSVTPPRWRLTERGNQRTSIFLHMHVCRYLARDGEKCPFLPSEVYEGKVFDPAERDFERYVEGEKEKRLRALFWGEEGAVGLGKAAP